VEVTSRGQKTKTNAGTAYAAPASLTCYEPPIVSLRLWVNMCASLRCFFPRVLLGFLFTAGGEAPALLVDKATSFTRGTRPPNFYTAYRLVSNGQKPGAPPGGEPPACFFKRRPPTGWTRNNKELTRHCRDRSNWNLTVLA